MLTPTQKADLQKVSTPWPAKKPSIKPSKSKWFARDHAAVFRALLGKKPNGIYLEMGTWTGNGSTQHVTSQFPRMSVICVDTFEGSAEHKRIEAYKKIVVDLWDHFCGNHWGNQERVYPMRMTTAQAITSLASLGTVKPDFIYIDAAHDAESVYQDIKLAVDHFPQAQIFGDDYTSPNSGGHPGVRHGLERAVAEKLIKVSQLNYRGRVWHLTQEAK